MSGLTVSLLGGFEARLASGEGLRLPTRKAQALLAYLSLRPGQRHQRDKLAALLWGDRGDAQARDGLRHALAALRKVFSGAAPVVLEVDGPSLALTASAVEVDVATFERLLAEGTPEALEQAADLYRGDLLLGFTLDEALFEEWLIAQRERLREMALEAMARVLAHQTRAAGPERAIQTAVRLLALDPLQEAVHRALMRLYSRQGRRGAALKQYQACVAVLQRELGTEPEAETRRLYQELLRRPPDVMTAIETPPRSGGRPTPAPPDLPSIDTPLFGREPELGRLRGLLEEACRGHGHVVTLLGEAGIGKSRLAGALATEAIVRGSQVAIGRCHESDSVLSFGPWVDALRSSQLSADGESLAALHPQRRAELTRLFPEASETGLPPAGDAALPLFESVAALIEHVAARQPLVLVLEDLHWADEISLRLLAFVSRRVPAWRVLVVATARDDELADASMARRTLQQIAHLPGTTPVTLPALSRSDTGQLVRALTRGGEGEPALAGVEARVWAMSEGNPFVAVETLRALDQPTGLALPTSVRELVVRRLDRLGPHSQHLVAVAAVLGRRFDFGLLRSAGRLDEMATAGAVEEMVRHRVLQAVGDRLDFVHDRIRDVADGRLLAPRRQLLHRAVVEALEAREHPDEVIEQLADHAVGGALWDRAVRYLRQAGEKALARSALADARARFEGALGVLETLPPSRATLTEGFEIRLALRPALSQLGEHGQALAMLQEAKRLAERLEDQTRLGRVHAFMTNLHARMDDLDAAIASGQQALTIAERLGDQRLRILATSYLVQAHNYRGEFARTIELATSNLAALPADSTYDFFGCSQPPSVADRSRLLIALGHVGRFADAADHETELIRTAERTRNLYTIGLAHHAAASFHLQKGDWARARAAADRHLAMARAGHIADEVPRALAYSARALVSLGDTSEALSRALDAERRLEDHAFDAGFAYYMLGRTNLALGRVDDACRLTELAWRFGSSRTDFVPGALHLLGDIASHPHRLDAERAEDQYRRALALAGPRGLRPMVAHCHLGLGTLQARLDKPHEAREYLATAAALYREMGMQYWLGEAEAAMARTGGLA
jgi:DNA-binding SARP family transcriptional activator